MYLKITMGSIAALLQANSVSLSADNGKHNEKYELQKTYPTRTFSQAPVLSTWLMT